ncbi:MAG: peptidylprolyl isomerase [Xanthomonadales bacterium]|nr:peptidylprolyl isomerase [Xanthomonadales bacterium]
MRTLNLFLVLVFSLSSFSLPAEQDKTMPEGVIAIRGDGVVTQQMFDARMSKIPEKDRAGVLSSPKRLEGILADLVLVSQLSAAAEKAGYDKDEVALSRMQLAAETELGNAWLDHYVNSQPAADYTSMAHEYYLLNQKDFETKASRDVSHLLVSTKTRTIEEAEERASALLAQIEQDPSSFDQLILENSDDQSMPVNKGHFKAISKGNMVKPFEEALFSLKTNGDFSGLVYTQYGIHIIRLDGINPARIRDFEEVREQLELIQESEHLDRIRLTYMEKLVANDSQISEEEIRVILSRYMGEDKLQDNAKAPESE